MVYKGVQRFLCNLMAGPNRLIFWSNDYIMGEGYGIFLCANHKFI
ncbi:hypothetical protein PVAP13_9KG579901 [Panicum virgatum]|uniref:Uncharacterized protein n=1 Tax=Panicum virgatum TaxID=38727 RepID=A0A8T0P412_PANVG|nr:hypothetical protein PVAP13_9KG579901 [Panicum virgatum]